MRAYLIEDLRPEDLRRITARLEELGFKGPMDGLYFLPLPAELLEPVQAGHPECGPHVMALEVWDETTLKMELLVRARNKLRCDCVAYATPAQRAHMIDALDRIIHDLDIPV